MSGSKYITIFQGEENKTHIHYVYDKTAYFYPEYRQAASVLAEIVQNTADFHRSEKIKNGQSSYQRNRETNQSESLYRPMDIPQDMRIRGYANNILSICADRGQGKTSMMLSISRALAELSEGTIDTLQREFWSPKILDSRFVVLDSLDPAAMEKHDSIMRTILSRMFTKFRERWDDSWQNHRDCSEFERLKEYKDQLLDHFQKCFKTLDILTDPPKADGIYDDLTYLAELGDSARLKQMFMKLVHTYLEFWDIRSAYAKDSRFLVIQVDDVDIKPEMAYDIVEELRKYCTIPNVIVLLSTNLSQLKLSVEQELYRKFRDIETYYEKRPARSRFQTTSYQQMMEAYIEKLFPVSHRIFLSEIGLSAATELQLRYINKDNQDILEPCGFSSDFQTSCEKDDLQYKIIGLVYRKTRIVLTKPQDFLHNLIPGNFRRLTHLLSYLNELEDIPSDIHFYTLIELHHNKCDLSQEPGLTKALELWRENLNRLMSYWMQDWIPKELTGEQINIVSGLEYVPLLAKKDHLSQGLLSYGLEKARKLSGSSGGTSEYQKFLDTSAKKFDGMTYRSIYEGIREIKHLPYRSDEFKFFYAIHMYLSIYMNLLALEDLEKGLKFQRLRNFVGGELLWDDLVVPPESTELSQTGTITWKPDWSKKSDAKNPWEVLTCRIYKDRGEADQSRSWRLVNERNIGEPQSSGNKEISFNALNLFVNYLWDAENLGNGEFSSLLQAKLLNVVLNYDVRYRLIRRLKRFKKDLPKEGSEESFTGWIREVYRQIDEVASIPYCPKTTTASGEDSLYEKAQLDKSLFLEILFSNRTWREDIQKKLMEAYDKALPGDKTLLSIPDSQASTAEQERRLIEIRNAFAAAESPEKNVKDVPTALLDEYDDSFKRLRDTWKNSVDEVKNMFNAIANEQPLTTQKYIEFIKECRSLRNSMNGAIPHFPSRKKW